MEPHCRQCSARRTSSVLGSLDIYDGYLRDMGVVAGGWTSTFTTGDYIPANGRMTFPPGTTNASIQVPIVNDGIGEPNETFYVNLTGAANATLMDGQAVVTIVDDDGGPPPPPPNPLGDVVVILAVPVYGCSTTPPGPRSGLRCTT